MRTYQLTIAYDGSRYRGWQRQPDTELTIQGMLEKTIGEMTGYAVEVNGSGRTDGGVHARAQAASVVLAGKVDDEAFLLGLNEKLPDDIRVFSARLVKNGFHARRSARGKCYEYTIDTGEKANPFMRKYTFHYPLTKGRGLNVLAMRRAALYLLGTHDFAAFTDRVDEKSTVRRIDGIDIVEVADGTDVADATDETGRVAEFGGVKGTGERPGIVRVRYKGSGFLYHMVRILTGTLLEVGTGKRAPKSVKDALESGSRADAGFLAPASGLCLMEAYYGENDRDRISGF